MKISKYILKAANTLVSYVVILSLCIAGVYAGYALWDNSRVYATIDDAQADMLKLKPEIGEDQRPSFDELLTINSDVVGWVTLDNTNIDYPVLQGETNLSYINTDIYGEFSLAGSIFLDSRNDRNFEDNYSLLYGHSMSNSRMFGDINLYKDEDFFKENQTGILLVPDKVYKLKVYATLVVPSNEDEIFNPILWQDDIDGLIKYANNNALYLNNVAIENINGSVDEELQILALTTCSYEFTDARTVVLAVMEPVDL